MDFLLLCLLKIYVLSKKDTSNILSMMSPLWPSALIPKTKTLKVYEISKDNYILENESMFAIVIDKNLIFPFLANLSILNHFPYVLVDMGAIKPICGGANIARPGIKEFSKFQKDTIVVIKDVTYMKPIAIGLSQVDSEVVDTMTSGYIINNYHYIGDKFWKAYKEIH